MHPSDLKMNPLTQTLNQLKMNERELEMGLAGTSKSWHQEYKDSAWVFLGGLPYEMTEGDVICMFSQYGEPVIEFSVALNSIRIKGFSGGAEVGEFCYLALSFTLTDYLCSFYLFLDCGWFISYINF